MYAAKAEAQAMTIMQLMNHRCSLTFATPMMRMHVASMRTGMRMLDCKVNQLFVSKEEVTYSPDDKYKAMVEKNPHLAELRKLFPMIDY